MLDMGWAHPKHCLSWPMKPIGSSPTLFDMAQVPSPTLFSMSPGYRKHKCLKVFDMAQGHVKQCWGGPGAILSIVVMAHKNWSLRHPQHCFTQSEAIPNIV